MLNVMRSNLKHLKWILLIVCFSFVMYLGAYFDRDALLGRPRPGANADWAAYVGDDEISVSTLERHLGNLEESYRQQLQGQFEALRKALRLPQVALNDLVNRELMLREARRMGLTVSPEEVRAAVLNHPAFRNTAGFIGKERYQQVLAANNLSPVAFEKSLADDLLIEKFKTMVTGPVMVSDQEIEKAYKEGAETVSFDYLSVPPGRWQPATPSEAEARAYFDKNISRYRKSDGRTVSHVLIDTSSVGQAAAVTAEEVRRYYDENQSSFRRPEQRRARHILLKVDPAAGANADAAAKTKAEELARRARAGEDFPALARQYSQDTASASQGGDLGWFGRGAMVPEFEQVAFTAKPLEIVGPVKSGFGYHVVQVTEQRSADVTPFEEVRDDIARQLEAPRRRQAVSSKAQELVAAANDPAKFEETARAKGYTVRDSGVVLPGGEFPGLGAQPALLQAIFATPAGKVAGPVQVQQGAVVFKVTGTSAASKIGFDQVRALVLEDMKRDKAREAAERGAKQELAASGGTIEGMASRVKLTVQKAGPVRKGEPLPGLPPDSELKQALFQATPGGPPLVLTAADGTALVAKVTTKGTPNATELAARRDEIRQQIEEQKSVAVVSSFIRQLRQSTSIRTNDELLERLSS